MPDTSVYTLPYQGLGDAPHGPDLGKDLAEAVEAELLRIDGEIDTAQTDISDLETALANVGVDTPSWTPTWSGLTIGNATVNGRYITIGRLITVQLEVTFGSSSSYSSNFQASIPVAARSGMGQRLSAMYTQAGDLLPGVAEIASGASVMTFRSTFTNDPTMPSVTNTSPWTWASGSTLRVWGAYFAA